MNKYLFIVLIALMAQCISAQALTKNGSVVTESTVSTLKVGTVTYPNTDGVNGQILTTNGAGFASWVNVAPSVPYTGATGPVDLGTHNLTINGISFGTNGDIGNINIGIDAGANNQGTYSVAIGSSTGQNNQGSNSVAIGLNAGQNNQGSNAIAIGSNAGNSYQAANSIILNASSTDLNSYNSGFFVSPINATSNSNSMLTYNTNTNEISYDNNKTFVINHPIKPDSYLVHACLEGPEAGVYYRGESKIENNQSITVKLPEYVSAFATNFSIQITAIYEDDSNENIVYRTSRVKDNSFTVHGKNGSFYWIVYGQRGKIEVEPKKTAVEVGGDGPYKYIKSKK